MNKSLLYAILVFTLLFFLWWFSGGSLIYSYKPYPSPAEKTFAFIWQNFNAGLATIFNFLLK